MAYRSHVRKVIEVSDTTVTYLLLHGSKKLLRKHIEHICSIRTWRKWCKGKKIEIVPEVEDYSIYDGLKIYKNYLVLRVNGEPLMQCVEPTIHRYLKRNILKQINEDVYQLTNDSLENRFREIYGENLSEFFLDVKNSKCVVCGITHGLSRHHVTPRRYIGQISTENKMFLSNILFICRKCHDEYELLAESVDFDVLQPKNWMNHFIETMQPKHLSPNWNIQVI